MRTIVFKDQNHFWYCRTPGDRRTAAQAIRTALVARDILAPGVAVQIRRTEQGEGIDEYRTRSPYPPGRVAHLAPGSHVRVMRHNLSHTAGTVLLVKDIDMATQIVRCVGWDRYNRYAAEYYSHEDLRVVSDPVSGESARPPVDQGIVPGAHVRVRNNRSLRFHEFYRGDVVLVQSVSALGYWCFGFSRNAPWRVRQWLLGQQVELVDLPLTWREDNT